MNRRLFVQSVSGALAGLWAGIRPVWAGHGVALSFQELYDWRFEIRRRYIRGEISLQEMHRQVTPIIEKTERCLLRNGHICIVDCSGGVNGQWLLISSRDGSIYHFVLTRGRITALTYEAIKYHEKDLEKYIPDRMSMIPHARDIY
jgi:hypothetical protein